MVKTLCRLVILIHLLVGGGMLLGASNLGEFWFIVGSLLGGLGSFLLGLWLKGE